MTATATVYSAIVFLLLCGMTAGAILAWIDSRPRF